MGGNRPLTAGCKSKQETRVPVAPAIPGFHNAASQDKMLEHPHRPKQKRTRDASELVNQLGRVLKWRGLCEEEKACIERSAAVH